MLYGYKAVFVLGEISRRAAAGSTFVVRPCIGAFLQPLALSACLGLAPVICSTLSTGSNSRDRAV